jgi:hypothetical protein
VARIALFNGWTGIPRQMAEIGSILGTTGSMGASLMRETPPWTSMEIEIEFQGNWLHCTEAYDMWWEKQVYSISNLFLLAHCGDATRDARSCTRFMRASRREPPQPRKGPVIGQKDNRNRGFALKRCVSGICIFSLESADHMYNTYPGKNNSM